MSNSTTTPNTAQWIEECYQGLTAYRFKITDTLFDQQSPFQHVQIVTTEAYGRMLLLDGAVMTTERDEFVYHEMLTHIPLLAHPNPKRVLIIGGGDGGTVREVLKHPSVEHIDLCEIDGLVIEASQKWLPSIAGKLTDPKVTISVADGLAFTQEAAKQVKAGAQAPYDIVLIDSTDPVGPGEVLFTPAFYQDVFDCLSANGIMANQSESPMAQAANFQAIYERLSGVFPVVAPYWATVPTYPGGYWTWMFCSKAAGPLEHCNDALAAEIEQSTHFFNRQVHRAVFALPNFMRRLLGQLPQTAGMKA